MPAKIVEYFFRPFGLTNNLFGLLKENIENKPTEKPVSGK